MSEAATPIQRLKAIAAHLEELGPDATEFFEGGPALMCILSKSTILRVNHRWEDLLGWSTEELQGISWRSMVHPEDLERTEQAACRANAGEDVRHFVNRWRKKNGGYAWLSWVSSGLSSEGFIYAFALDISDEVDADHGELVFFTPTLSKSGLGKLYDVPGLSPMATIFRTNGVSVTLVRVERGAIVPLHSHREKEVLCIYSGELQFAFMGEKPRDLKARDVVTIQAGQRHWSQAVKTTLMVAVLMPASDDVPIPSQKCIEALVDYADGDQEH